MFLKPRQAAFRTRSTAGVTESHGRPTSRRRWSVVVAATATLLGVSLVGEPVAHAQVVANSLPVAVISKSVPPGIFTVGTPLTLDGSGSYDPDGQALKYEWIMWNPNTRQFTTVSREKSLVYRFTAPGDWEVFLTVTDPVGGQNSKTFKQPVSNANARPKAVFTKSPSDEILVGTTVTLDASRSSDPDGDALAYEWWIDDDSDQVYNPVLKSRSKVYQYAFRNVGVKSARLVVTDPTGSSDELTLGVRVTGSGPVANFTQSPASTSVSVGTRITFDGSRSTGEYIKYAWLVNGANAGTSPQLNYTFGAGGTYNVTLNITDTWGRIVSKATTITVTAATGAPVATFTQAPNAASVAPGTAVTFDGSASAGSGLRYEWRVRGENGVYSTSPVLSYRFRTAGDYGIQLTVIDSSNQSSKKWTGLTVTAPPVATFAQSPAVSRVATGTEVTFDGSASTGSGLRYEWRVRGENRVVNTTPVLNYRFRNAGDYGVELTVIDSANQVSKKWIGLSATAAPVARFTQAPASSTVATGTQVRFDGSSSSGEGLKYEWRVRGESGVVNTTPVLEYTFRNAGDYGVELTITDAGGLTAKKWIGLTAKANSAPIARFTQSPTSLTIRKGTTVTFDGAVSSDPDGDRLAYYWYVRGENGVVTTSSTLRYPFNKAGKYGVELIVADPTGASSKKWIELTVTG